MLALIRKQASLVLSSFDIAMTPSKNRGVVGQISGENSYLTSNINVETFLVSENFLLLGCPSCNNNQGWIKIYEITDIRTIVATVPGNNSYRRVGASIVTRKNASGAEEIIYGSSR